MLIALQQQCQVSIQTNYSKPERWQPCLYVFWGRLMWQMVCANAEPAWDTSRPTICCRGDMQHNASRAAAIYREIITRLCLLMMLLCAAAWHILLMSLLQSVICA